MQIEIPQPQENNVFLYHRADNDGFGAYFAARRTFEHKAAYYGIDYGDEFDQDDWGPVFADRNVFFMDCVGPRDFMCFAAKEANHLTIIDHHENAFHELQDIPDVYVYCAQKSAAVLTWDHLRPEDTLPAMFLYIQDRDLWKWELPQSQEFNAGLDVIGHDYDAWAEALFDPVTIITQGKAALALKNNVVEGIARNMWECEIGGLSIGVVNATAHWSDVCHYVLTEYPDIDVAITWYEAGPGKRKYSFRSRENIDVRPLVQELGGGGHAQASGLTGTDWPYTSMVWQTTEMAELDRVLTNKLSRDSLLTASKES